MKKLVLTFVLVLFVAALFAQSNVTWTSPVVVSNNNGYQWPRICLVNNEPLLTWGFNGSVMTSRFISGSFTIPQQISPAGMPVIALSSTGPDVISIGDTVYVSFIDDINKHVYLQRSFNGGITFSDTIRVDNIGTDIAQYATVAVKEDGNPVIAYARLDVNFTNPQYAVVKSYDAGNTFTSEVSATSSFGADPCDCCPGSIVLSGNNAAVIYRNAIADVRDFRASISADTATTFNSIAHIDTNNWVVASCPSSGGTGIYKEDTLISVFMNALNGPLVYVSTYNVVTFQLGMQKPILSVSGESQDFPRIAGNGDTIGVVWTQTINGSSHVLFSYSFTGAAGLGLQIDTVSWSLGPGFYMCPDIIFSNGVFHIAFNDDFSQVFYCRGSINSVSGIELNENNYEFSAYYSEDNNELNIKCQPKLLNKAEVKIFSIDGNLVDVFYLDGLKDKPEWKLKLRLTTGIYLVSLMSKDFYKMQQIMVPGK